MTNQQHPITPPPELIGKWEEDWHHSKVKHIELVDHVATEAARWGADQDLEASCAWLAKYRKPILAADLKYVRRPKPPSEAEQALAALDDAVMRGDCITISDAVPTLRRALERLKKLEQLSE